MAIKVQDLSFSYTGNHKVLDHVNFTARDGEVTVIIGSNGVGKTTLFRCILNLCRNYTGRILIDDKPIRKMSRKQSAARIAYVPQNALTIFNFTCLEIVLMGANHRLATFETPDKKERESALSCMEKMNVAHLKDRPLNETSGGERQLVMIARALMQKTDTLMLDEPVSNLDFGNQIMVMEKVRSLADEGFCVLLTSHNPQQAYLYADSIAACKNGRILAQGDPKEIITAPLIKELYHVDTSIASLFDDRVRICVPESITRKSRG